MDEARTTLLGVFDSETRAADAIKAMGSTNFIVEQVHSPIPSHVIEAALQAPKSKVGWFTLVGAVIGFLSGFSLAAFTASRWHLIVSGKPVLSWIPFVIVGFEFTILFAVLGNVVGLISLARLPQPMAAAYDPRLSGDHFGLTASCPAGEASKLADFFQQMGAEAVPASVKEGAAP